MPRMPSLLEPYGILVTGIGGTGVVTVGQILAMAAHVEGKGALVLDMSGLAQKGGPVMSHVRLADRQADLHSTRVGTGSADLVIGCDQIVTASRDALSRMGEGRTRAFVNNSGATTAAFIKNPDWQFPGEGSKGAIVQACGADNVDFVDAGQIATALMGDAIATNMFMLGYAFQKGQVPLQEASIMKAIELNGVSVPFNKAAFNWGRTAAHDLASVVNEDDHAGQGDRVQAHPDAGRPGQAPRRTAHRLPERRLCAQYKAFVDQVRAAEEKLGKGTRLTEAVARYLHKLMAYKDEYEVARLYTDPAFMQKIAGMFEGDIKLKFHLAPPLLAKKDKEGPPGQAGIRPVDDEGLRRAGEVQRPARHRARRVRLHRRAQDGTRPDREYRRTVEALLPKLTPDNLAQAVAIASIPEDIRGFGHVKERHLAAAKQKEAVASPNSAYQSLRKNSTFASCRCALAAATFSAPSLTSSAVMATSGRVCAMATAMAPEPVPMSSALPCCGSRSSASSTSNSVSGRGIRTSGVTCIARPKNSRSPTM
jgi:indolepyruvate ferredoxin oxidoreductase